MGALIGASRSPRESRPPWGIRTLRRRRRHASLSFVPLPLSVLAEPDFEEQQEQGAAQPQQDEGDQEYLAGQSADQDATRDTRDHEQGG